uniref:Uncharacterized protein n=1 Tax=Psilocybe cubensis TaxID=181762 RepID=A0A8H8CEK9_PSICU
MITALIFLNEAVASQAGLPARLDRKNLEFDIRSIDSTALLVSVGCLLTPRALGGRAEEGRAARANAVDSLLNWDAELAFLLPVELDQLV